MCECVCVCVLARTFVRMRVRAHPGICSCICPCVCKLNRFQLRRELDNAKQLNLFQRSESGSLTRFRQARRSFSTEPHMDTVQVTQRGTPYQSRGVLNQNTANDTHVTADRDSPSRPKGDPQGSLSPLGSSKDGLDNMTSLQLRKEMEKRDEEFLKIVAKQVKHRCPRSSPLPHFCNVLPTNCPNPSFLL